MSRACGTKEMTFRTTVERGHGFESLQGVLPNACFWHTEKQGDYVGFWFVLDYSPCVVDCSEVTVKFSQVGNISFTETKDIINLEMSAVKWPYQRKAPASAPECGFDNEKCQVQATNQPSVEPLNIGM